MDGTDDGEGAPMAGADGIVEEALGRLRCGGDRIDCPETYARAVLREALGRHGRAVAAGREPAPATPRPVKFAFRESKALESVLFLLTGPLRDAPPAPMLVHGALYQAEREHLLRWGRPIFCDTYMAAPTGPVGSMVDRMLRRDVSLLARPDAAIAAIGDDGRGRPLPLRQPDTDVLSKSDVEMLAAAAEATAGREGRRVLARHDRAWRATPPWGAIDWAAMIDPGEPGYEGKVERIEEMALFGA